MGRLANLILHCSATPQGRNVTKEDIIKWHTAPKPEGRGWSRVGYSDMIALNGDLINLQDWDQDADIESNEFTNGARGYNAVSRHVVYVGGMDKAYKYAKDTRTVPQEEALITYVRFHILRYPWIKILGHNQISSKACPSFDVPFWLRSHCIGEDNIYG